MTTDDTPIETSEAEARPWKPSDGYLPAGGDPTQPAMAAFDAAVAEVGVRNIKLAGELREAFGRRLAALGSAPDGWRLAPVEPTDDMNRAAVIYANGNAVYKNVASDALKIEESIYGEVWSAMLAAAPQLPAAQPATVKESLTPAAQQGEHLLQDQSRGLSQWLASQPDARLHAREAAAAIAAQQGEAVAPDDMRERIAAAKEAVDDGDASGCAAILRETLRVLDAQPAAAPQPVAQGVDYGVALLAAWDAVRDPGPAGDDVPHPVFAAGFKAGWSANAAAPAGVVGEPANRSSKASRVHALVNAGPYPGMSEAFDAHMGAPCWTDPAYAPDASTWAAAWKAALVAVPPARQALTDEQIDALPWWPHEGDPMTFAEGLRDFARAIERAHGIGGKGGADHG